MPPTAALLNLTLPLKIETQEKKAGNEMMKENDVVIIGGGPAGRVLVHALHAQKSDLSVTLIKDEPVNVNRCAVPYGVPAAKPLEKFQISNKLVTDYGARLVVDFVESIDTDQNLVVTRGGEKFRYKYLVLATGSRPIIPPLPGVKADRITAVRYLDDLSRLRQLASAARKAVVVGGGYIGVELAVVLQQMGLEVYIVEMLPHILQATTEPEFVQTIESLLAERGMHLMTNHRVVEFQNGFESAVNVRLDPDQSLPADLVALSIGVAPNTELAARAGLKTSRLGIVTDKHLRTSVPNIYASGDCVEKWSFITQQPTRGEFGTNAVFMSKVVAQNILGKNKRFPGVINASATSTHDWSMGSAGLTEQMAREAGIDPVTGYSEVPDKYPMMEGVANIRTKLIFDRKTRKLIGGSVLRRGTGAALNVDFISLAIQMGTTLTDLLVHQYATHPELAAKPSDNAFVFAAKDALGKL